MGLFNKTKNDAVWLMDESTFKKYSFEILEEVLHITATDMSVRTLPLNQIIDVAYTTKVNELTSSKSPIGRALVGGALLGPLGAVVGAVSGVGNKTKKNLNSYLIIAYTSSDGEDCYLTFLDYSLTGKKATDLFLKLREKTIGDVAGKVTQL